MIKVTNLQTGNMFVINGGDEIQRVVDEIEIDNVCNKEASEEVLDSVLKTFLEGLDNG